MSFKLKTNILSLLATYKCVWLISSFMIFEKNVIYSVALCDLVSYIVSLRYLLCLELFDAFDLLLLLPLNGEMLRSEDC